MFAAADMRAAGPPSSDCRMSDRLTELLYRHRLSSPVSWLALAAITALGIWIASKLVWLLLQWNEPLPEPLPNLAPAQRTAPAASLSKWHLFGNAAPLEDHRALANAPATQLDLKLLGVWAGRDPRRGRAIIADAAGVESSVAVGREVVPGVVLDQVLRDRVVLLRGGAPEVLHLSRDAAVSTTAPAAPRPAAGPAGFVNPAVVAPTAAINASSPSGPVGAPNLPLQGVDMEAVRRQIGADPYDLAQNLTTLPVMENGKLVGVRLFSSKYAGTLAKLGLQGDDVVTSVNGVDVGDPARIAGVIANLQNTRSLSVTVRRNGKTENLSVDLN
jgi:general secretion pathway protein C